MALRSHLAFLLNGQPVALPAGRGADPVLAWLREERGLAGTKEGCAEGDCGACTVVVAEARAGTLQYRPAASCILPLGALDGRALITVEGLSGEAASHPVQRAMVECHGSQCGFCTPGFVMALYAHHQSRLPCTPDALRDALAGNLCRCTGYAPILAAGERMAALRLEPDAEKQEARQESALLEALSRLPRDGVEADGYYGPRSIAELAAALDAGARPLGGGTDLGLGVTKGLAPLGPVAWTGGVEDLRAVEDTKDGLRIGGGASFAEAAKALGALHPDIAELLRRLGGAQVRAFGTLAGNIANGSPIGDSMPVLLALGATLELQQGPVQRDVPLAAFYTGYRRTVLQPAEFIRAIRVPRLAPGDRFACYKLSKRFDQDISGVCAAFFAGAGGQVRFGFGGMAATPSRAPRAEAAFPSGVEAACAALAEDVRPLSDHRASAWYRLVAAQNLLRKFAAGVPARALLDLAP